MITILIVLGLFFEIGGIIILVWYTDKHLQVLMSKWGRIPVGANTAKKEKRQMSLFRQRGTIGGMICICLGFSMQTIGLVFPIV